MSKEAYKMTAKIKNLLPFLVSFTTVLLATDSTRAVQQPTTCIFAVVLDTSPADQWGQIDKAAENIFKSVNVGDTILLFEVRGLSAHLCFSGIKQSNNGELDAFQSALQDIKADWFLHADLARALQGPIYEKLLQHAGKQGQAIIVVLSEGGLSHEQASDICKFAEQINSARRWSLVLTGSAEKTNRDFLIAAGKGRFNWCKLADATDRVLFEKLLQKLRPNVPITVEKVSSTHPIIATHEEIVSSKKNTAETDEVSSPKFQEPNVTAEPNNNVASKHLSISLGNSRDLNGTPELNLAGESNAFKPQSSLAVLETKVISPTEIADNKPSKETVSPTLAISDDRQVKTASPDPEEKVNTSIKSNSKTLLSSTKLLPSSLTARLLAIGGISATTIIACFLLYGWAAATSWQQKLRNPIELARRQNEKQPRVLMAQVGGSSFCLGNPRHFNSAHLGSSPENTIRISNEAIAPRHLHIFRRGDNFFVRNLAKTTIFANGQEISRRKRHLLIFPAAISLCENISVNLFLTKSTNQKQEKLEESQNGE
jgi:hypothetical protein